MAYRDPYAEQPGRLQHQPIYNESTPDYNPYSTSVPHQTYDQGGIGPSYDTYGTGYRDEPQYDREYPPERSQSQRTYARATNGGLEPSGSKEINSELGRIEPREKRHDRAGVEELQICSPRRSMDEGWTRTVFWEALLLHDYDRRAAWIRPPNITIGNVETISKGGSAIQLIDNGIQVNLGVNISVNNPNYFAVNFKQIKAEIFYPINGKEPQLGEGISKDVVFRANQLTNWTFPFAIQYKTTDDPQGLILQDLASKCGVGGAKSNIKVNYKITLGLRILFITVSPVVQNNFDFMCPLDPSDLEPLIKSTGIGGLLGS
ncbi:hypothetical protein D9615_004047 [Tricholomella constricta]|uniref:Late embryogenesis abundant protein LEA-2 subgroup domain-containing protein n=1 Tax=Tricholomella constricta TaxID=117010 RepID=A0A8H5HCY2_9AGAR|nr:hypothetical protein D9615_004047 [Tricholomella constricta]